MAGHHFNTRCDTEVVLHQIEAHGTAGLAALNGMFAFAVWDQAAGRLLLARDRIGIKPLYYAPLPDGGIVFGSELSAVLRHPAVSRRLSPKALVSIFSATMSCTPKRSSRGCTSSRRAIQ